jgi:hypothetical protein
MLPCSLMTGGADLRHPVLTSIYLTLLPAVGKCDMPFTF